MKKYFINFLFIQIFLFMFIFAQENSNSVKNIDVEIVENNIVIKVITDISPEYKYFSLESDDFPFKVAVDIGNAKLATSRKIVINKGPVKQVRLSQWYTNPDIVRFVIDLTEKVDYEIKSSEDGVSVIFPYKKMVEEKAEVVEVSKEPETISNFKKDSISFDFVKQEIESGKAEDVSPEITVIPETPELSEDKTVKELVLSEDMIEQRIEMMNYKNISIIDLLRVFSELYSVNIVISKDVLETDLITVRLQDVPLNGALEAILTANEYNYVRKNDILLIKSRDTELADDLQTEIFHLQYVNAGDIIENLRVLKSERGFIEMIVKSPMGKVGVTLPTVSGAGGGAGAAAGGAAGGAVERSNILIVTDYPGVIENIRNILKEVDKPPQQVRIEVKLIETKLDDKEKWGINWTSTVELIGRGGMASGAKQQGGGAGGGGGEEATSEGSPGMQVPGKPLFVNKFHFGTLSFSQLKALLEMLEQRGNSRLLNQPSISVLNNQQADIAVGTIIPIEVYQPLMGAGGGGGGQQQQGMMGGTTVQQQFISISLTVIPQVNDDKYVTLWIQPNVSEITGYTGKYGDLPITSTRTANSQVRVKDGDTVIIGGLIKEDKFKTTKRVKFLSNIPLLGNLFTYKSEENLRSELVIFITPYIIRGEEFIVKNTMVEN